MILDNGKAPITESVKKDVANVPRSAFNMSRVKYMNGLFGALMPFDVLETLPNEDYTIGYDVLAELRNPTTRKLLNGMKIFIHSYWCPKKDLWRGFKNYIDKGRSGTVTKTVPKLSPMVSFYNCHSENGQVVSVTPNRRDITSFTPFAPSSFMGIPPLVKGKSENKNLWFLNQECSEDVSSETDYKDYRLKKFAWWTQVNGKFVRMGINALPFMMYAKIFRDYYANENMLGLNKEWYHDDDDEDLILPYDIPHIEGYVNTADGSLINYGGYYYYSDDENSHAPSHNPDSQKDSSIILNQLYFRQFRGDYFTSANIFRNLIRGNEEDITADMDLWADQNFFEKRSATATESYNISFNANENGATFPVGKFGIKNTDGTDVTTDRQYALANTRMNTRIREGLKAMTLNSLRKALVLEKFMQRNATTNGSYRELIGVQFGYYPKDETRKPTYIGGAEYNVNFNTITATNYDATSVNLGQKTTEAYASSSGYIGKFHSDDYGYIMSIMTIVPDVYYASQGLDTMWTRTSQDQEYFPIKNNLEPMAIKNKEVYFSTNVTYNEDVFGYADRYADMKQRRNEVTGLALCGEKFDRAQFMLREFTEGNKPNLNPIFSTMLPKNIDMTPFTSAYEPPFDIAIGCNIEKVSPMPYKAEPMDMGINY